MPLSYLILDCFSMAVGLGVGIYGLLRYRICKISIKLLVWYVIIWFAADIVEFTMSRYHIHNLWVAHCDNIIEVTLFVAIVFNWRMSKIMGAVLLVSFISFTLLWMVSKFTFEPMSAGDDITFSFSRLLMICFALYLLFIVLHEQSIDLKKDSRFWVAAGFIVHSVGTLLLFSSFNYLISYFPNVLVTLYPLNWIFAIIAHLFFARGIWCQVPQGFSEITNPVNAGTIPQSKAI